MEELFTITSDPAERQAVADALARRSVRAPVVLTLRADFVAAVSALPALARLVQDGLHLLGPMSEAQLRAAVTGPATRAGLRLEPGLVDVVLRDVEGQAGALPLLSHALAETWVHRDDRVLTIAGYRAGGGVQGAVAATADRVLDRLSPDGRRITRSLFLPLISLSDAGAPISHRRRRADLVHDDLHDEVLDALLAARLLTADAESVEVTHEALGRAWPRLRTWLDEDRDAQRLLLHLTAAAAEWERSGRDDAELYRGGRLRTVEEWMTGAQPSLSSSEKEFLDRSIARQRAEEEDLAAQAVAARRTSRRLRALLVGVAVVLVVALITGGLFLRQRNRADRTARVAKARQLASQSTVALDQDPELAILLALQGIDATRSAGEAPVPEALSALQEATQASRIVVRRDDGGFFVDATRDGSLLATASTDTKSVLVRNGATGDTVRTLDAPCPTGATCADPYIGAIAFSPNSHLIAVAYQYADAASDEPMVILWDADTGAQTARLMGPARQTSALAFNGDGTLLAASSNQTDTPGRVTVWDVASGTERFSKEPAGGVGPVAFVADPPSLLVAEAQGYVDSFALDDERLLDRFATPGLTAPVGMAVDPTSQRLAITSQDARTTQLWALGPLQRDWSVDGEAGPVSWSPSGDRLAIAGSNQSTVRVVDAASGRQLMALNGHVSGSWDVAFVGTGDRLASVGVAGGLRIWDVTDEGPPALGALIRGSTPPNRLQFSPDGAEMLVVTGDGAIERVATSGAVLASLPGQRAGLPTYSAVASPDWRRVASVSDEDGRTVIRDLATFQPVRTLAPCDSPQAFSPDGSLLVLDGRGPCTVDFTGAVQFQPTPDSVLRSRVIDVDSGSEVLDLGPRLVIGAAFNPAGQFRAGRYLAVNVDLHAIEIYDMDTRRMVASLDFGDDLDYALSFDPRGRWLSGGTANGRSWVMDLAAVAAGKSAHDALVFDQDDHKGGTSAKALSADGVLATVGVADGVVRLWRFSSGTPLVELRHAASTAAAPVAFSPDGQYMVYTDGIVLRRYLLHPDALIALARSRLTRTLTADECRRYLNRSSCN